jgi:hypothetical protein
MIQTLKLLWLKLIARFPHSLPVGMQEFEAWSNKIIALAGNIADELSMKYVLAAQIISLKPNVSKVPLTEFVNSLRKAAANQIAHAKFQEIKTAQQEAIAAQSTPAADTAAPAGSATNEQKT